MGLSEEIKKIGDFVFPDGCLICGRSKRQEDFPFCTECRDKFLKYRVTPLESGFLVASLLKYEERSSRFYIGLKTERLNLLNLERLMEYFYNRYLKNEIFISTIDYIVTIPSRSSRFPQLIGEEVGKFFKKPVFNELIKNVKLIPQKWRKIQGRRKIKQGFLGRKEKFIEIEKKYCYTSRVSPPKVLLVDDIVTTGETLKACKELIEGVGSTAVIGAVTFAWRG